MRTGEDCFCFSYGVILAGQTKEGKGFQCACEGLGCGWSGTYAKEVICLFDCLLRVAGVEGGVDGLALLLCQERCQCVVVRWHRVGKRKKEGERRGGVRS